MVKQPNIINYLEAGLRAASLKQAVIANNIANLETPGYRRHDVEFEEHLAQALKSSSPVDLDKLKPRIIQPMNTPVAPNGNDVSLDTEVGEMIKNATTYKTYLRLLSKVYRQMELAMGPK